ncbi:MAG: hypothetical protein SPJ97_03870 [Bacteroides sp.]|nr:hypothetical protein [Bacteroides sp.]
MDKEVGEGMPSSTSCFYGHLMIVHLLGLRSLCVNEVDLSTIGSVVGEARSFMVEFSDWDRCYILFAYLSFISFYKVNAEINQSF